MVHRRGMVHSVDRGMVHHGGGMVDSMMHWGGVVHSVVGGGVVSTVLFGMELMGAAGCSA